MSTVSLMTSLLTEDCCRFLLVQHKTLGRRLFEDVYVVYSLPFSGDFIIIFKYYLLHFTLCVRCL